MEAEQQRKGLSLAPLFAKPRPMWTAPAFVGAFGDTFIEKTNLEGTSVLAWSYSVINFSLQQMMKQRAAGGKILEGLPRVARTGLSDVLHVMSSSAEVFKIMTKMLKDPSETQMVSFLRKLRKLLQEVPVGEALLLPALVENNELLLLLNRTTERMFTVVVIQTDAMTGLRNHSAAAAGFAPEIRYRTCMVVRDVPKRNVLDDVFWTALYNLSIHSHQGDIDRFYDILLPFLSGKPLETSLVEAELAATRHTDMLGGSAGVELTPCTGPGPAASSSSSKKVLGEKERSMHERELFRRAGDWRVPQRSKTSYVRCIFEALHYLLRSHGLSALQAKQVHLALSAEMVDMALNDMAYMSPPDNGQRVCAIALRELSNLTVKFVDEVKALEVESKPETDTEAAKQEATEERPNTSEILTEVHALVQKTSDALAYCQSEETDISPPLLDLTGLELTPGKEDPGKEDPVLMQFMDQLMWEVEENEPDPGQLSNLRRYLPVDLLQIPERARTREEATRALRMCDRLCTLIDNQSHCIKNDKFLIVAAIEHVVTQVL